MHTEPRLEGPAIAAFALAGNAIFTISNPATGARFTFRVSASDDGRVHFVAVLTGADNDSNYTYLGFIRRGSFEHGRKSRIGADAPSARAFEWFWRHRDDPAPAVVQHAGRCGRCARTLTVPESIATGFGPDCAARIGAMSPGLASTLSPYSSEEITARASALSEVA